MCKIFSGKKKLKNQYSVIPASVFLGVKFRQNAKSVLGLLQVQRHFFGKIREKFAKNVRVLDWVRQI
jgi:hypothetical protein